MSTTAARLSTAQRRENRTGVGMQNTVTVQGRPVTGQGMSGVQTRAGTAGPRRSIQDSSYYVGLLTAKNTELQTEIRKMQNEIDTHEKDGNLYKRLEKKYETLIDEVRDLEGTLADYNLAKDKARMTTDPQQIKEFQMRLKEKNSQYERKADDVYRMKQAQIGKTAKLQQRIEEIKHEEAAKIEELGFDEKQKFVELQKEKESAQARIAAGKSKMEEMKHHIKRLEEDIKFNTYINEYKDLSKRLSRLEKEKETGETEASWLSMDPEQARKELLHKVKSSNAEVKATQAKIAKTGKANESARKHLEELTTSIEESKGDNEDSQKCVSMLCWCSSG
jgi:intraflagellar transport protein 74